MDVVSDEEILMMQDTTIAIISTDSSEDEIVFEIASHENGEKQEEPYPERNEKIRQRTMNILDEALSKDGHEEGSNSNQEEEDISATPTSKPPAPTIISPEEKSFSRLEVLRMKKRELELTPAKAGKLLQQEPQDDQQHADGDTPNVPTTPQHENLTIVEQDSIQPSRDARQDGESKGEKLPDQQEVIRFKLTNSITSISKELVAQVSAKVIVFDCIRYCPVVKEVTDEAKRQRSEIMCCISAMEQSSSKHEERPPLVLPLDRLKNTTTERMYLENKIDGSCPAIQIILQSKPNWPQSRRGATSISSGLVKKHRRKRNQLRVRVVNTSSKQSKNLVVDVSDKLSFYTVAIKRANVRQFKGSIVQQVKQQKIEIIACVTSVHSNNSPDIDQSAAPSIILTVDQMKETTTKDLFNWKHALGFYDMDDASSVMIQIALQWRPLNLQPLPDFAHAADDVDEQLRGNTICSSITEASNLTNQRNSSKHNALVDFSFDNASVMETTESHRQKVLKVLAKGILVLSLVSVVIVRLPLIVDFLSFMVFLLTVILKICLSAQYVIQVVIFYLMDSTVYLMDLLNYQDQ